MSTIMGLVRLRTPSLRPRTHWFQPRFPWFLGKIPCARPKIPWFLPKNPCARGKSPCAQPQNPCARAEKPCAHAEIPCARALEQRFLGAKTAAQWRANRVCGAWRQLGMRGAPSGACGGWHWRDSFLFVPLARVCPSQCLRCLTTAGACRPCNPAQRGVGWASVFAVVACVPRERVGSWAERVCILIERVRSGVERVCSARERVCIFVERVRSGVEHACSGVERVCIFVERVRSGAGTTIKTRKNDRQLAFVGRKAS